MALNTKAKYAHILKRPRITEKANLLAAENVHIFEIDADATKKTVAKAVDAYYGVKPLKITIAKNPSKKVFVRGKFGFKQGVKKAYVFLKKGDKIE